MRLIEPAAYEYIQEPDVDGLYKAIRDAAAICYQTDTDKMKLSPKEFVENVLLKNGHTRPLEFGTVYLRMPLCDTYGFDHTKFIKSPYTRRLRDNNNIYVVTNLRVLAQGEYETDKEAFESGYDKNWFDDLKYWCEPNEWEVEKDKIPFRRTFRIIGSRGAGDDFRTHVHLSAMMESSRYCNYSKDKFGNELTFIRPYWIETETVDKYMEFEQDTESNPFCAIGIPKGMEREFEFLTSMRNEEVEYMKNAASGLQPQQLKRIYPLGAKAELRLCGFDDAWENFFWRRCDTHADPECQILAKMTKELYCKQR